MVFVFCVFLVFRFLMGCLGKIGVEVGVLVKGFYFVGLLFGVRSRVFLVFSVVMVILEILGFVFCIEFVSIVWG